MMVREKLLTSWFGGDFDWSLEIVDFSNRLTAYESNLVNKKIHDQIVS